jgi:hypothetical protein
MNTRTTLAATAVLLGLTAADAAARPGELDRSYGSRGVALTRLVEGGSAAALARDGRLYVAGGVGDPALVRLSPRGRRDRRFGPRGRVGIRVPVPMRPSALRVEGASVRLALTSFGGTAAIATVTTARPRVVRRRLSPPVAETPLRATAALRPDGGALVTTGFYDDAALTALRSDAALDPAFGSGGTLAPGRLLDAERPFAIGPVAVDAAGRVLVALGRYDGPTVAPRHRLLRLTPTGAPDPAFGGGDGFVDLSTPVGTLRALPDGGVLVAGTRYRVRDDGRSVEQRLVLRRLAADGTPERRAFGGDGVASLAADGRLRSVDARRIVLAPDGGVVLALFRGDGPVNGNALLAKVSRGGRLVRGFGRRGLATIPSPRSGEAEVAELLLDRRGGLLVAGRRTGVVPGIREDIAPQDVRLAVWRYRLR